jgi:hypothetical protein
MNAPPEKPASSVTPAPEMEARLSGAYHRIQRVAIALSVTATLGAVLLVNWQSGLGLAVGSALAFLNFVWLHRGAETMVQRMLTPADSVPARLRLMFHFPVRYLLVIAVAYVILKSYPKMLIGFIVGLVLPVLATMGEGIYEAFVISKIDRTHNQ